jgi:hypothetical protein
MAATLFFKVVTKEMAENAVKYVPRDGEMMVTTVGSLSTEEELAFHGRGEMDLPALECLKDVTVHGKGKCEK